MNKIVSNLRLVVLGIAAICLSSCNDFLNDIPKGQKTPTTWEDYNAFMKNNYFPYFEMDQLFILTNDQFKSQSSLNSDELAKAHYFWEEETDRTLINSSDKGAYYYAYEAMFYWNLIIQNAPSATECTQGEKDMLIAQAKVLRALTYFYVANYYSAPYSESNRKLTAVPLVTSSDVTAPSPQVTVGEIYDFMVKDLTEAIDFLPKQAESILHPTKAAGLGLLARVYLHMGKYEDALKYASLALDENDKLYSWIQFYNDDKERFTDPEDYNKSCKSDPEKENVENYVFHFSSNGLWNGVTGLAYAISAERAAEFEEGDTRLLTHWKERYTEKNGLYYTGIHGLEPNKGGIRTPEMYYIKAECLARKGGKANIDEAMSLVNKVRKTRILPEFYQDWSATTTEEAVKKIIADKNNEYIQNLVVYCDYRRLNLEPAYAKTLTKKVDGKTYQLKPDSHMWIMPFPIEVINNPGNGTIVQNVNK